jgi:maltose/moltooligosaccharide transporter
MMIVILCLFKPSRLDTYSKTFLNNDPRLAISFAGVLLLISAGCTLLIKTKRREASE